MIAATLFALCAHLGVPAATTLAQQPPPTPGIAALRRQVDSLSAPRDSAARLRALQSLGRAQEAARDLAAARESYRSALALATGRGDSAAIALARHSLGAANFRSNRYDSALVHLGVARELRIALGDRVGLASTLNSIGASHYQMAQYEAALEAFLESLELRRTDGDRPGVTRVLTNIGKTYQDWKRYDRALRIFEEAIATADPRADPFGAGYAENSIGRLRIDTREFGRAREHLERSLALYRSDGPRTVSAGDSLAGWLFNTIDLALLHVRAGSPDSGLAMIAPAVAVAARDGITREEARARLVLGEAYRALARPARAIVEFRRSLALSRSAMQRVMSLEALAQLADLEQALGNTGEALRALRGQEALRDTIFDDVTAQRIATLEARAESERQSRATALLVEERRIQEALIARQRIVVVLAGLVLLLGAVVVVQLVRNGRRARERQAALTAANAELVRTNYELRAAMTEVRTLTGFIPICANCKNVRDDRGFWEAVESFISNRSSAMFSHSLCPDCGPQFYGADWDGTDVPPTHHGTGPAAGSR